jgi:hypothetical protein
MWLVRCFLQVIVCNIFTSACDVNFTSQNGLLNGLVAFFRWRFALSAAPSLSLSSSFSLSLCLFLSRALTHTRSFGYHMLSLSLPRSLSVSLASLHFLSLFTKKNFIRISAATCYFDRTKNLKKRTHFSIKKKPLSKNNNIFCQFLISLFDRQTVEVVKRRRRRQFSIDKE